MRIVEFKSSKMEFWELHCGDVFKTKFPSDKDEKILMKCKQVGSINAVDLETGTLYSLTVDADCMLVDTTLTVKPNID